MENGFPRYLADELFHAEKRLLPPKTWLLQTNSGERETGRRLDCPVEIDGITRRGVAVVLLLSSGNLNKCSFSLLARHDNQRTRHPIYRLDLNPTTPHSNPFRGPSDLQGLTLRPGNTHEHCFLDNLSPDGSLFGRCDQVARPLENPPSSFSEGLDYFCRRLHILNIGDVPKPQTQGELL